MLATLLALNLAQLLGDPKLSPDIRPILKIPGLTGERPEKVVRQWPWVRGSFVVAWIYDLKGPVKQNWPKFATTGERVLGAVNRTLRRQDGSGFYQTFWLDPLDKETRTRVTVFEVPVEAGPLPKTWAKGAASSNPPFPEGYRESIPKFLNAQAPVWAGGKPQADVFWAVYQVRGTVDEVWAKTIDRLDRQRFRDKMARNGGFIAAKDSTLMGLQTIFVTPHRVRNVSTPPPGFVLLDVSYRLRKQIE